MTAGVRCNDCMRVHACACMLQCDSIHVCTLFIIPRITRRQTEQRGATVMATKLLCAYDVQIERRCKVDRRKSAPLALHRCLGQVAKGLKKAPTRLSRGGSGGMMGGQVGFERGPKRFLASSEDPRTSYAKPCFEDLGALRYAGARLLRHG